MVGVVVVRPGDGASCKWEDSLSVGSVVVMRAGILADDDHLANFVARLLAQHRRSSTTGHQG
jgi:hypothetical protein